MAYDEKLAGRVRALLEGRRGIAEKRMFGGVAFLLQGKMCCGVLNADLVARVGVERYESALKRRYVRPMDFTGRPIKGFVFVGPRGVKTAAALAKWLRDATEYVSSPSVAVRELRNATGRRSRATTA